MSVYPCVRAQDTNKVGTRSTKRITKLLLFLTLALCFILVLKIAAFYSLAVGIIENL